MVDLDDGRVVVIVGDAAASGLGAGDVAEDLRARLRRVLWRTQEPAAILMHLSDLLAAAGEQRSATCICAVIDPASRLVRVSNAGHLPLVLVESVGASLLQAPTDPPLGTLVPRREVTRRLPAQGALFFYTSGLLARSRTPAAESLDALVSNCCSGLNGAAAWASEFARRATEHFGEPEADATVVSVRLEPEGTRSLVLTAPPALEPVALRVYLDPADLRSRALLRILGRLAAIVREVELGFEVIDVTAKSTLTEDAGVLASPTIVRVRPDPPVRVVGWFDSALALARALQLPVSATDSEGTS